MQKLDKILSPAYENWFRSTPKNKESYKLLFDNGFLNVNQEFTVPHWEIQKLDLLLGYK